MRCAVAVALLLAGCGGGAPDETAPDLETAAIARGLVRDPAAFDPVGLYARDTDRLCIVADEGAYRVGAFVDYGDGIACSGAGRAVRRGGALGIDLGGDCAFDARFDGDRIVFPGRVPDACARLCDKSASFAALDVARLSNAPAEAAAMRSSTGKLPCAAD